MAEPTTPSGVTHLDYLQTVANEDVQQLLAKERDYQGSWKRRGGVGAFMMLARKWDRIEVQVNRVLVSPPELKPSVDRWDVLEHARVDTRPEGLLDDIGDLRRYLLLVEAEVRRLRDHASVLQL